MKHQEMSVRLIARPELNWHEITKWVEEQGGHDWVERVLESQYADDHEAQVVVEAAGRRCYKSWAPGLNPNVTKVREDSDAYLRNIVSVGHGSVLEHAQYTFSLEGISRVVTHELVRHRVGVAISQESLRYVRLTDIPFRIPDWIQADTRLYAHAKSLIEAMEQFQVTAAEHAGIDDPDRDFHYKKEVTSDLRRFAPIGLLTGMVWSANLRTLRQTIEARTAPGAEREIRELFHRIGLIMVEEAPAIFADFKEQPVAGSTIPAWVPETSKV